MTSNWIKLEILIPVASFDDIATARKLVEKEIAFKTKNEAAIWGMVLQMLALNYIADVGG